MRVNVKYWLECVMLRHVHVACFQCCSGFKSAIYTSIYHDFLKHNCVRLYTHMLWLWHLQYVAGHTQCSTESASGIVASQVWWNVPGVHCSSQVCRCAHCTSARYDEMCRLVHMMSSHKWREQKCITVSDYKRCLNQICYRHEAPYCDYGRTYKIL